MSDGERKHRKPREAGTRAILDSLANGNPDDLLTLGDLLEGLDQRAFGILLLIALPPSLIPAGGAITGPLAMWIGVQLAIGLHRPWLMKALAKRGVPRHAFARFDRIISPMLGRIEHVIRPRLSWMLDSRVALVVTGLLLVVTGFMLSLPIPFTNYLFGAIVLVFALALIERDGVLMIVAWVAGLVTTALSWNLAVQAAHGLDLLF